MKYEKVIIKEDGSNLPEVDGEYFVYVKETGMDLCRWTNESDSEYWLNTIDWYLQPLPEQESKELTDLKQYVTNLLYEAHGCGEASEGVNTPIFDQWVEEQTNNLNQYFQSHPEARGNAHLTKSLKYYKDKYKKCINVLKKYDAGIIGMYDL